MAESDWIDAPENASSGSDWIDAPEGESLPTTFNPATRSQAAAFTGASALKGLTTLGDLGLSTMKNIFTSPYDVGKNIYSLFTGGEMEQPNIMSARPLERLQAAAGAMPEDVGLVKRPGDTWDVPKLVESTMGATVMPGGPLANAASGLFSEVAHQAAPESQIAPLVGAILPGAATKAIQLTGEGLKSLGESVFNRAAGITARDYKAAQLSNSWASAQAAKDKLQGAMQTLKDEGGLGYRTAIKGNENFLDAATAATKNLVKPIADKLNAAIAPVSQAMGKGVGLDWDEITRIYDTVPNEMKTDWLREVVRLEKEGFSNPLTLADIQANKLKWNARFKPNANSAPEVIAANEAYRSALQSTIEKAIPEAAGLNQQMAPLLELQKGFTKDLPAAITEDSIAALRQGLHTTGGAGMQGANILAGPAGAAIALASKFKPVARVGGLLTEDVGQLASLLSKIGPKTSVAGIATQLNKSPYSDLFTSNPMPEEKLATPEVVSPKRTNKQFTKAIESLPPRVAARLKEDPFASAVAQMESSYDPKAKNPNSTAKGLFQFINDTARRVGLKDPMDPEQSLEAFDKLTKENKDALKTNDPTKLYAAHILGWPLLKKYLAGKPLKDDEQEKVDEVYNEILPRFNRIYHSVEQVEA